jgi:hypothetical protein
MTMRGFAIFALVALFAGPAGAEKPAPRPCPSLSPDAFAKTLMATRVLPGRHFGFGGAFFARASGTGSCVMTHGRGGAAFPTCRFTNPRVVQVSTAKGRFDFLPGPGPATVTVRNGEAACTMAAG